MDFTLLIKATVAFFVITDSIGNTPIFSALMRGWEPEKRRKTINKSVGVATIIFLAFAFLGTYILGYLGISLGALRVAGGVLLMIIAFSMIHGHSFAEVHEDSGSIAVTPMAIPLMAGPASLTTVMLFMSQAAGTEKLVILLALFISIGFSWLVATYADALFSRIHRDGLAVTTQIMGVILAALAIEMAAGGLKEIFPLLR